MKRFVKWSAWKCSGNRLVLSVLALGLLFPSLIGALPLRDDPRVGSALHLLQLWLEAQMAYEKIPGISMAVVHDQEVVWAGGLGYADRESKKPAGADTIYGIGSISKLFTGIAMLQLRDQGKLHLDDPVDRHLPWFYLKQTYPDSPPITIRGLLTHSSGLPRDVGNSYWSAPYSEFPTREELIKAMADKATVYPADTRFQYSNLGFALAGEIVAAVSGQSYADYVKQSILVPLGLTDTMPELPTAQRGGRLATGYSSTTRAGTQDRMPFFQAKAISPAAGFSSTVLDLARFASWQFRVLHGGREEILKTNTLKEMQRYQWMDADNTWGLGFTVWNSHGNMYAGHGGICAGYRSQITLLPKEKIAVVFLTNSSGVNSWIYAQRAIELLAPVITEALSSPAAAETPDPALKKYEGIYDSYPWGGDCAVFAWKGNLAMVDFPTTNPRAGMTILNHVAGNRFRAIDSNGEAAAEETIFETNAQGKVIRMWNEGNFKPKMEQ